MKLNVAICDDSNVDLTYVSQLLKKWGQFNNIVLICTIIEDEFCTLHEEI